MAQEWHYITDGQQLGPVDSKTLKSLAAGGKLRRTDLVWTEKINGWIPAEQIKGLFPEGTSSPPIQSDATPPPLPGSMPTTPPVFSDSSSTIPSMEPPTFGMSNSSPNLAQKSKTVFDTIFTTVMRTKDLAGQKLRMENINFRLLPEAYSNVGRMGYEARIGETMFPALFAELDSIRSRVEARSVQSGGQENKTLVDKTLNSATNLALDKTDNLLFTQKLKELGGELYAQRNQFIDTGLQTNFDTIDGMIAERDDLKMQLAGSGNEEEGKKNRWMLAGAAGIAGVLCLTILYYGAGFVFGGFGPVSRVKKAVVYKEFKDYITPRDEDSNKLKTMTLAQMFDYRDKHARKLNEQQNKTGPIKIILFQTQWGTKKDTKGRKIVYFRTTLKTSIDSYGDRRTMTMIEEFHFQVTRNNKVDLVALAFGHDLNQLDTTEEKGQLAAGFGGPFRDAETYIESMDK